MHDSVMEIQENVCLAPLTTLNVGGPARFFVKARTNDEVINAIRFAQQRNLPLFVLGGGSNVVISDRGFDGLVLQIAMEGIEKTREAGKIQFDAAAGVDWDNFVAQSVSAKCAGIECLSGIPGTVGGTPVQNVGAYGQEVSQTITSVLAFDLKEDCVRELSAHECGFGYRTSIFNTTQRGRYIVLRVTFALSLDRSANLTYADLQKYFAGRANTPSLLEVRDAVLKIRASKGMLINLPGPDGKSVGSFFKNPILSEGELNDLQQRAESRKLRIPVYPALAQLHKVSAAWLVENSGFSKGYQRGKVGISSKHALAIINRGGASATEIIELTEEIQNRVSQTWGIKLQPEPVFVGFELPSMV